MIRNLKIEGLGGREGVWVDRTGGEKRKRKGKGRIDCGSTVVLLLLLTPTVTADGLCCRCCVDWMQKITVL